MRCNSVHKFLVTLITHRAIPCQAANCQDRYDASHKKRPVTHEILYRSLIFTVMWVLETIQYT